jgi:hypothetical protein
MARWRDGCGWYDGATSPAMIAVASFPDRRCGDRPLWAVFMLALVVLGGCAGFEPQPGPLPEPGGQYVTLTTPFIAVGDTQEHESTGYPLHDNDSAIDAFVKVAQRPPEQPLFGRRILEWALEHDPDEPFIHLGDVMDLSCQSEAQRMDRIFKGERQPVAILPGNHDGLMFGIYGYRLLDAVMDADAKRWNRACRRGAAPEDSEHKTDREALSKRDFIVRYLRNKAHGGRAPGLPEPPVEGDFRISWRNPEPQAFISAMEVRLLDGYQYADSFLAQRLHLPRAEGAPRGVVIIGLDTNQAGSLVSTWDTLMGRSPGTTGHIHPYQIQVVRDWVIEAVIAGDIVVFAGHHNWSNLGLPSRLLLRNLMSILRHPLVYLSAHTHRGFWAVHTILALRPVLELNVSSLSDWPIGYRRISFAIDEQANRLLVRGDLMPHGDAPSLTDDDLMAAWEAQTCARSGLKPEFLRLHDAALVKRQRDSRGSIIEWLLQELGARCEDGECQQTVFQNAQSYQDELLLALIQVDQHLGVDAHALHKVKLPEWCHGADFSVCATRLMDERATDFNSHVNLFRRKAGLVDIVSNHLDDISTLEAKAYMTCRAVQAARIDFIATEDKRNDYRSEANRRAEHFFRIEASVGME